MSSPPRKRGSGPGVREHEASRTSSQVRAHGLSDHGSRVLELDLQMGDAWRSEVSCNPTTMWIAS